MHTAGVATDYILFNSGVEGQTLAHSREGILPLIFELHPRHCQANLEILIPLPHSLLSGWDYRHAPAGTVMMVVFLFVKHVQYTCHDGAIPAPC